MSIRTAVLYAALTALLAAPAHAGPPWISIELPANPHHASTRHASMLIRTYHHSTALNVPIIGTAEGLVDGRRVSLGLEVRATNQTGVYAVHTPLPTSGTWILAFTLEQGPESTATALVTVDPQGRIVDIAVPSNRTRDGWLVPQRVQKSDIEAALRTAVLAHGGDATGERRKSSMALPLLLLGGVAAAGAARLRQT